MGFFHFHRESLLFYHGVLTVMHLDYDQHEKTRGLFSITGINIMKIRRRLYIEMCPWIWKINNFPQRLIVWLHFPVSYDFMTMNISLNHDKIRYHSLRYIFTMLFWCISKKTNFLCILRTTKCYIATKLSNPLAPNLKFHTYIEKKTGSNIWEWCVRSQRIMIAMWSSVPDRVFPMHMCSTTSNVAVWCYNFKIS